MTYSLGRLVEHDHRSRAYPYRAPASATLTSVRHERHCPVLDQQDSNGCTGFAETGALATGPLWEALNAGGVHPTYDSDMALRLYALATSLDEFPGTFTYPPPGGTDGGSSGLAVAKAAQQDGWLSGYQHAFSFDDDLAALAVGPLITGVNWYTSFDSPGADGEMPLPKTARVRGGHELCVDELDVENERVWVTNSWGQGWGQTGRAWWSFATWEKLLGQQGDATILVPVTEPAPTPTPPAGDTFTSTLDDRTQAHVRRLAAKGGAAPDDYLRHYLRAELGR